MAATLSPKLRHQKKARFIAHFERMGNISAACRAAEIDRDTYRYWMEHDEEFGMAVEVANQIATEFLEEVAHQRAALGVEQETPIYHRGQMVGSVVKTEYSDTLLIFLLKARAPEKYRETIRTQGTISSPSGGPIEVKQEMSDHALSTVIAAAEKAAVDALYGVAAGQGDADAHR